ncbi:MAG: hypothetical protein H0V86_12405 [Chloroflexia bacterium]|nr:hypothetical protein [Chloroflexia bacterium]
MLALILLAAFAALGLPTETRAHSQTTDGYSRITVREDVIRYHLSLDFDELRRVTSLDVPPVATTAEREAALLRDRSGILAYLEPRLVLRMDEVSCQGVVAQTRVENISGQVYAGIVLDFTCPGGAAGRLQVRYGVFFDDQDPQHRNIATYRLPGHNGRFIFARDARDSPWARARPRDRYAGSLCSGLSTYLRGTTTCSSSSRCYWAHVDCEECSR